MNNYKKEYAINSKEQLVISKYRGYLIGNLKKRGYAKYYKRKINKRFRLFNRKLTKLKYGHTRISDDYKKDSYIP